MDVKWILVLAVALVTVGLYVYGMRTYAHATWREVLLLGYGRTPGKVSKRPTT